MAEQSQTLQFSVDPDEGESGAPLAAYLAGIHPETSSPRPVRDQLKC
jgi:hypothetical protein